MKRVNTAIGADSGDVSKSTHYETKGAVVLTSVLTEMGFLR